MPQPALHLMLAGATLQRWHHEPDTAPFAIDDTIGNAFLVGSLGPDLGLFPGGDAALSRLAHTARTGELLRVLLQRASTPAQQAFAWGWLTHILADVAIHPLVNAAAAELAREHGEATLIEHVRVEVGLDAWYACDALLPRARLRTALNRDEVSLLSDAFRAVYDYRVTPQQLLLMQHGALHFTNLALYFASSLARELCWNQQSNGGSVPFTSTLVWRLASSLSGKRSVVYAYINPVMPGAPLLEGVDHVVHGFTDQVNAYASRGVDDLPDYNLENGTLLAAARCAA